MIQIENENTNIAFNHEQFRLMNFAIRAIPMHDGYNLDTVLDIACKLKGVTDSESINRSINGDRIISLSPTEIKLISFAIRCAPLIGEFSVDRAIDLVHLLDPDNVEE